MNKKSKQEGEQISIGRKEGEKGKHKTMNRGQDLKSLRQTKAIIVGTWGDHLEAQANILEWFEKVSGDGWHTAPQQTGKLASETQEEQRGSLPLVKTGRG